VQGQGPPAHGAGPLVQGARPPAQGAGPLVSEVRPMAPTTIPQLDGSEPDDFGSKLNRQSAYETIKRIMQLYEAGRSFGPELEREDFYEAVQLWISNFPRHYSYPPPPIEKILAKL